ncbi:MAG: HlyC/CorC family transporter [Bacteroidaceae bacterium]|nr:HlyC/CorC family transporter [Bacteroidaceae bacterium]
MGLVLFYMLLALSVSFLCSVLEAVLLSTPISFIAMKEQEGARNAALMMRLKKDPDRPLSAILSFNTIAHTIGSAGVGAEATKVFGDEWFGVISTVLTLLILVLSEIIPKTVGSYYWRQLAMMAAPIIRVMIVIMYPLVWLSEFITKLVSKDQHPLSVSREEVTAMVSVGTEEGVFETQEKAIIQNLFKLDNITVGEIMTPRTVVVAAQENMLLKEFYSDEENRSYSRIPIYGETPDFMTGYILKQTLLENLADDKFDMELRDIRRPLLSYDEDTPVGDAWEEMLKGKEHIAQVRNEYGLFLGVVSMEDIIETIIGQEIVDEKDTVADLQEYAREKWKEQSEQLEQEIAEQISEENAEAELTEKRS